MENEKVVWSLQGTQRKRTHVKGAWRRDRHSRQGGIPSTWIFLATQLVKVRRKGKRGGRRPRVDAYLCLESVGESGVDGEHEVFVGEALFATRSLLLRQTKLSAVLGVDFLSSVVFAAVDHVGG